MNPPLEPPRPPRPPLPFDPPLDPQPPRLNGLDACPFLCGGDRINPLRAGLITGLPPLGTDLFTDAFVCPTLPRCNSFFLAGTSFFVLLSLPDRSMTGTFFFLLQLDPLVKALALMFVCLFVSFLTIFLPLPAIFAFPFPTALTFPFVLDFLC